MIDMRSMHHSSYTLLDVCLLGVGPVNQAGQQKLIRVQTPSGCARRNERVAPVCTFSSIVVVPDWTTIHNGKFLILKLMYMGPNPMGLVIPKL